MCNRLAKSVDVTSRRTYYWLSVQDRSETCCTAESAEQTIEEQLIDDLRLHQRLACIFERSSVGWGQTWLSGLGVIFRLTVHSGKTVTDRVP